MEKLTLLELHFDGETSFGRSLPTGLLSGESAEESGEESEMEMEMESEMEEEDESSGSSPLGLVVGLVLLMVVAAGVRRLIGGDGETDEYEPEMVEIEE